MSQDHGLKELMKIDMGALSSRIVSDTMGRRCIAFTLSGHDHCITINEALQVREMLDIALRSMPNVTITEEDE